MKIESDGPHWLRRLRCWLVAGALACTTQPAIADPSYADSWGPEVGAMAPLLEANDQDGTPQTLETLTRPHGLLLVFNRSVDW